MTQVVVTVGTDHHPFERLLDWAVVAADRLDVEVVAQVGATPIPDGLEGVDFMPAPELATLMRDADAVVCHGGPGTIAQARSAGHRPIVVARDPILGEHVDDHQLRFAAKLAREGAIDVAASLDELIALLASPRERRQADTSDETERAVLEFASLIDRLVAGDIRSRRWSERLLVRRVDRRGGSAG